MDYTSISFDLKTNSWDSDSINCVQIICMGSEEVRDIDLSESGVGLRSRNYLRYKSNLIIFEHLLN